MTRVFLDGSVLFTAARNPGGRAVLVVELGAKGFWKLVTSTLAVEEARHNISRTCPEFGERFEAILETVNVVPTGAGNSCGFDLPARTRQTLESARMAGANRVLTAGRREIFRGVEGEPGAGKIVAQSVGDFLSELRPEKGP